jgi:hypothetical protein
MKHVLSIAIALSVGALSVGALSVGFSAPSYGAETIDFDGGKLTYESGQIDPETLNGRAKNVTITFDSTDLDDPVIAHIDRYFIDIMPENDQIHTGNIKFSGITIRLEDEEDLAFHVKKIDMDGQWHSERQFADVLTGGSFTLVSGMSKLSDIRLDIEDKTVMTIDGMTTEVLNADFNTTSGDATSGESFLQLLQLFGQQSSTGEISNLKIYPRPFADKKFIHTLDHLGLDHITANMTFSIFSDLVDDRMNIGLNISLDLERIGVFSTALDMGMLLDNLVKMAEIAQEIEEDDISEEMAESLAGELFLGGFFNNAKIDILDKGLLEFLFAEELDKQEITRDELVDEKMENLSRLASNIIPITYAAVAPEIRKFLNDGGRLTISAIPPEPVPFSSFLLFAAVPDSAASALDLTVEQSR